MWHAHVHFKHRRFATVHISTAALPRRREMLSLAGAILLSIQPDALSDGEPINASDGNSTGELIGFSDKIAKLEVHAPIQFDPRKAISTIA
jgi:hypothetical protein